MSRSSESSRKSESPISIYISFSGNNMIDFLWCFLDKWSKKFLTSSSFSEFFCDMLSWMKDKSFMHDYKYRLKYIITKIYIFVYFLQEKVYIFVYFNFTAYFVTKFNLSTSVKSFQEFFYQNLTMYNLKLFFNILFLWNKALHDLKIIQCPYLHILHPYFVKLFREWPFL